MFSRSSSSIEPIYNYAEAVAREASIAHVRGTDGIKPLGPRRYKHMQILKNEDESIACRLYSTNVVTFKPNGDIVICLGGWVSDTTAEFAYHVLGARFCVKDRKMFIESATDVNVTVGWFPLRTHGENIFRRAASGNLLNVKPIMHYRHQMNRKGANSVRKRYADFRAYMDRMIRLRANEAGRVYIRDSELVEVFGRHPENHKVPTMPPELWFGPHYKLDPKIYADFQVLIDRYGDEDKTQDYYKAFLWLASGIEEHIRDEYVTMRSMIKALDMLTFFFHRDEVFDKTECFGQMVADPYHKFFSQPHDQNT